MLLCARCYAGYFVSAARPQTEFWKGVACLVLLLLGTEILTTVVRHGPLAQVGTWNKSSSSTGDFGCCPNYFLGKAYSCDSWPVIPISRDNMGDPDVGLCIFLAKEQVRLWDWLWILVWLTLCVLVLVVCSVLRYLSLLWSPWSGKCSVI